MSTCIHRLSTFNFPKFESAMLKINPTQPLILAIQQIRIIPPNRLQPIFTIPTQKSIKLLLAFLNLFQHAKNQLNSSIYSWDKADFRTLWHKKPCPFLTTPTQKLLKLFLTSLNLYLHAQNLLNPSLHSWNKADFRVQRPKKPPPSLNMPN